MPLKLLFVWAVALLAPSMAFLPSHDAHWSARSMALPVRRRQQTSEEPDDTANNAKSVLRQQALTLLLNGVLTLGTVAIIGTAYPTWAADEVPTDTFSLPLPDRIDPCPRTTNNVRNCVSSASVRQVDLYSPPWTFDCSADEALARLKGLVASDPSLALVASSDKALRVKATRPLGAVDQIDFVVNAADSVVTFISQRVDDPEGADFGANRQRLEALRQQAKGVFGVMGGTVAPREGGLGQLKAFYGLQSGAGFQDVLLDDE